MTFVRTTAINKIKAMTARKRVVQGGTSSGKTHGIIPIEIDYSIKNPKTLTTFVAETIPAVRSGCVKIFKNVMQDTQRWRESGWLGSPMSYTFTNGSIIEFKAYDTVGKAKADDKRDRLFMNECNHIPYLIADALMIRSKYTTMDFNPDNEFWAHTEVLKEPNSELLILNYKDNEACPTETIEDLNIKMTKAFYNVLGEWEDKRNVKSEYWANWCRVYVRGHIGSLEGVIFNNWRQIDNIPSEARLLGYGLDFGYSNDPTAIIEVYKWNDKRILNQICYEKGLSNKQIAGFIETNLPIYCDSAEPKSIRELCDYGLNAYGVTKGKDSINYGIQIIQDNDYLVTSSSLQFVSELRRYAWARDKATNTKLNKPIDNWNHGVDAWRYHEMETLGRSFGIEIR
jgi:phage terminase large subunit